MSFNMQRKRAGPESSQDDQASKQRTCIQQPLIRPPSVPLPSINQTFTQGPTIERAFDEIMERSASEPLHTVVESVLQSFFNTTHTIFWYYVPQSQTIFSPTFTLSFKNSPSFLSLGLKSRTIILAENLSSHFSYSQTIDSKVVPPLQPVLMIPVVSIQNAPMAIIQLSRKQENPFGQSDIASANLFASKFRVYSRFLLPDQVTLDSALMISFNETKKSVAPKIINAVEKSFQCRKAEIWKYDRKEGCSRLDGEAFTRVVNPGSILTVLTKEISINSNSTTELIGYLPGVDGYLEEPVLMIPYEEDSSAVWAVALRGRATSQSFSPKDASKLNSLMPFIVHSVKTAVSIHIQSITANSFEQRLSALLEVAEALSGVLQIDRLIPLIMSRSCDLLHSERCSLFLVDQVNQELVTRFHGGLSNAIRIPLGQGIVGTTATTGETIVIDDAYSDKRFDRSVDTKTGFRTRSLLSLPIYNNGGEIIGVTEIINKEMEGTFNDDDVRLMMGFNVFCGISLENSKLYEASLSLAKQVRSFIDISTTMQRSSSLRSALESILKNSQEVINANRAFLYIYNKERDQLSRFVTIGPRLVHASVFAMESVKALKPQVYSAIEVAQRLQDLNLKEAANITLAKMNSSQFNELSSSTDSRLSRVFSDKSATQSIDAQDGICVIPLISSNSTVVGAALFVSKSKATTQDIQLLECISTFASVTIERAQLKSVTKLGINELDLKGMIGEDERELIGIIPVKFQLNQEQTNQLFIASFDATKWEKYDVFKIIYALFARFGLLNTFSISNEKLFRFLCELRDSYNKVPYHNWRHAVDVTQFVAYEVIAGGLDKIFSQLELLALVISALCHDVNHDGFTNVYNVKAETPLGILFKSRSVMETHHCEVAIEIISKDQFNIFSALSPADFKTVWTNVINLILSTDMARHFDFLKKTESTNFDLKNSSEHRLLTMELLLKTGDISNVARPFEIADRWCDMLCEEFFRQGDLESTNGMEYTSPLNDREHLDKAKSQIGFYTYVCLPLYQATAKAVPLLECNVRQVQSNLTRWKDAVEKGSAAQ